mmetsp:Transcript_59715/g.156977  ORF Transcript_59715/g.156977 Transcript_59715/m.156977 type:complete len:206 (-) Transcript_59715:326-943(-)
MQKVEHRHGLGDLAHLAAMADPRQRLQQGRDLHGAAAVEVDADVSPQQVFAVEQADAPIHAPVIHRKPREALLLDPKQLLEVELVVDLEERGLLHRHHHLPDARHRQLQGAEQQRALVGRHAPRPHVLQVLDHVSPPAPVHETLPVGKEAVEDQGVELRDGEEEDHGHPDDGGADGSQPQAVVGADGLRQDLAPVHDEERRDEPA